MGGREPIDPDRVATILPFEPRKPAAKPKGGAKAKATPASWLDDAQRDHRGEPIPNLYNTMLALRSAPELEDAFALDEMAQAVVVTREPPGRDGAIGDLCPPRPATDADIARAQVFLQRSGLRRLGKDATHQGCDLRAAERSFHPVRTYLTNLAWDGRPRLDGWLTRYLGAEDTSYTAGVGAMFFVALVARIFRPGCKADNMVVLEGGQGARKSTACAIIGGEWFSDSLPDVTIGKDVSQHLPGKWLIEIGEMAAMGRVESAALKAFITRAVEKYRPSFGRKEVIQPRQCVFIGTTNKATYLKDETGGRRFWPVKVGQIDIDALRADRDQLFAEAASRYREGAHWWPDAAFEAEHIKPQQESRFDRDIWEDNIREYLKTRLSVYVKDVASQALHLETPKIGRADQNRIIAALERCDWVRGEKDALGMIPWAPARRAE